MNSETAAVPGAGPAPAARHDEPQFQQRVQPWMMACFGETIAADVAERNHRFLEEALELVQACGATADEAHQLVGYVFGRPVGEKSQEVGGVMVTLAALCLAQHLDMHAAGETELVRIWTKVDAIRAKQAAKPQFGPLPGLSVPAQDDDRCAECGLSCGAGACIYEPAQQVGALTDEQINAIILDLAELPDRDSPEDAPEMMLVSDAELRNILAAVGAQ